MGKIDLTAVAEEQGSSSGSDFFKIPVGDTRIRILSEFEEVKQVYEGEFPNAVYKGFHKDGDIMKSGCKVRRSGWAWCIVRGKPDEQKIITFPIGLVAKIANLRRDPEYQWDEFPMPYDITIHNTGEGGDRYSITPARSNVPVTEEEFADYTEKTKIEDIITRIKEKQGGAPQKGVPYPEEDSRTAFDD